MELEIAEKNCAKSSGRDGRGTEASRRMTEAFGNRKINPFQDFFSQIRTPDESKALIYNKIKKDLIFPAI